MWWFHKLYFIFIFKYISQVSCWWFYFSIIPVVTFKIKHIWRELQEVVHSSIYLSICLLNVHTVLISSATTKVWLTIKKRLRNVNEMEKKRNNKMKMWMGVKNTHRMNLSFINIFIFQNIPFSRVHLTSNF